MFDRVSVLKTNDLFIVTFNFTIVYLGNSVPKTLNGIKFLSLAGSILYMILL